MATQPIQASIVHEVPKAQIKRKTKVYYYTRALVGELFLLGRLAATYPFGLKPKQPKEVKHQRPILLIHGFLHNSSAWRYHRYRLVKEGFRVYYINLSSFDSIQQSAQKVALKAKQIAEETGTEELDIIGHSRGGLVGSCYATDYAPKNTVKRVITLGSPMNGTKVASLATPMKFFRSVKQMSKQSEFTQQQNKKNEQSTTKFYHLAGLGDLIVHPNSSALGSNKKAEKQEFSGLGHTRFLFSSKVFHYISKVLKEPI